MSFNKRPCSIQICWTQGAGQCRRCRLAGLAHYALLFQALPQNELWSTMMQRKPGAWLWKLLWDHLPHFPAKGARGDREGESFTIQAMHLQINHGLAGTSIRMHQRGSPWPPELGDAIGRYWQHKTHQNTIDSGPFLTKIGFINWWPAFNLTAKEWIVWLLVWFAAHPSLDFDYINVMLFLEGLEGNRDEPAKAQGAKKWRSVKVEEPTSLPLKLFHVSKAISKQRGALQTNLRAQVRSPVGMKTHVAM